MSCHQCGCGPDLVAVAIRKIVDNALDAKEKYDVLKVAHAIANELWPHHAARSLDREERCDFLRACGWPFGPEWDDLEQRS